MLAENLVPFTNTEFFQALIKLTPIPKEEKKIIKPLNLNNRDGESSRLSRLNSHMPMRRNYTQRTAMISQSEYNETYDNEVDDISRYSRKL